MRPRSATPPGREAGRPAANAADRRRVQRAVAAWAALTLGGLVVLAALVLWHLVRRGRLLRDRLGPARVVRWPDLDDRPPDATGT